MTAESTKAPGEMKSCGNRLGSSKSPYLLQHSENPVNWLEWRKEAFEMAASENKPIFLSIGYSTCHWCHYMAHESFEDDEVAEILNRYYVCIKVDREERPDIDEFYMAASHLLTGGGGWPLNLFLAPDKRPFMSFTTLPKKGGDKGSGLVELLTNIALLWRMEPERIEKSCAAVMEALATPSPYEEMQTVDPADIAAVAFEQLNAAYDSEYGGFGKSPKFPTPWNLIWLMSHNDSGMEMALNTLRRIRNGGIWDQVSGGIHRYAVDRRWFVPHFEKMLYDQALFSLAALEAYELTNEKEFLEMAENIFSFVEEKLTYPGGGFYSALDADSEGVEGKYYLWGKREIDELLADDSELFCEFYGIMENGNFENSNILNIQTPLSDFCRKRSLDHTDTAKKFERCIKLLHEVRKRRTATFRDEKILLAWNGLMVAALARGGRFCGNEYIERAERCADFILGHMKGSGGRFYRSFYRGITTDIPAFLEDYAFFCFALTELYMTTGDKNRLDQAMEVASCMMELFYYPEKELICKSGKDAEQMMIKVSFDHDGAIPSPFSIAAICCARLSGFCKRPELEDFAHLLLKKPLADARKRPASHLAALQANAMLE